MRRAEFALAVALSLTCAAATAQNGTYNKTDTFEPGKKYNCVPTADHKNWDCSETGKSEAPVAKKSRQTETPVAAAVDAAPQTSPPVAPPPKSGTSGSSNLPLYLTNSAASSSSAPPPEQPNTVSATAAHAGAVPVMSEAPKPALSAPPPVPVPKPVVKPGAAAPKPVVVKPMASKPAPPSRVAAAPATTSSNGGPFMELAGDRFVIELARGGRRADLDAARQSMHVPRGDVYDVHLHQNGADQWLLLWGSFDTIEAARAARHELGSSTSSPLGFPRRVAPLQAEARSADNH